ncbi:hypothetical protein B0H10DRAFT_1987070 [Mycena sp. CBHHK59/15]|nr:hypothetical protein B0H10DRAFT_1987070 [Mycena sp. CBHHK59/15]
MGKSFDELTPSLSTFILKQAVFWVATAPLTADGHVNLSPKGGEGMFHIVNPRQVWYEDLTGSGIETISHLRENRRITILFNAFEGPPRIVRLYGQVWYPEYDNYVPGNSRSPGSRAVILIDVHRVSTSCGFGVPFYDFKAHRTKMSNLGTMVEVFGLRQFWTTFNLKSIDGLTGLTTAPFASKKFQSTPKVSKPDKTKTETRFEVGRIDLVVAFSLGILLAALYVRLSQSQHSILNLW